MTKSSHWINFLGDGMAGSLAMSSYSIISTQNKNTIDIEFVVFSFCLIVSILRMKRNITD